MKLSERTTRILENFSSINSSILLRKGNNIATLSEHKTVVGLATIEESFPQDVPIFDLSRFLNIRSVFDDPDFEFGEKSVLISSGSKKVNYIYADASYINAPPEKIKKFPPVEVEFSLKYDDLDSVLKAGKILGLPHLEISGNESVISIRALKVDESKKKNASTTDIFSIEVGQTDLEFSHIFNADYFKLLKADYEVGITKEGASQFVGPDVTYFVMAQNRG